MALSKIDVANMLTGATPVANGGTGLTSGTSGQFLKFTGSTTLASASGGITMADQWRVTNNQTGNVNPITGTWERNDRQFSYIGSGMTESSGVFSFPSTGIYQVTFQVTGYSSINERYIEILITGTTDNFSSNATIASQYESIDIDESSATYFGSSCTAIKDVTDVSNDKVRFRISRENSSGIVNGNSGHNETYATFIRLGDT